MLQRKYPTLCIICLYIMYVTTFYIKIICHFPKKNNFMLVTPRTERYEGVLHIQKYFFSWWFSRLHIMWICHFNVGKTNRLKQNENENISCHQNMNRKKCVYSCILIMICAFPMQRAFVKVIIFLYGFCLERSPLLRISRSVVNLLYLAFV